MTGSVQTGSAQTSARSNPLLVLLWSDRAVALSADDIEWLQSADQVLRMDDRIEGTAFAAVAPLTDGQGTRLHRTLQQLATKYPEHDLLLFNVALKPPDDLVSRLESLRQQSDCPAQLVLAGRYGGNEASIDPLRGLQLDQNPHTLDAVVALCGDRQWQHLNAAPLDAMLLLCAFWTQAPQEVGSGPMALLDSIYLVDPAASPASDSAEWMRSRDDPPVPLGHLRLRVARALEHPVPDWPRIDAGLKPVTLHISHSWGGGVWRWIEDHIAGDPDSHHLVLVAVSDGPGRRCGQRLQLCVAGPGQAVIREFDLGPNIISTDRQHPAYRQHLDDIIERFGVGRVIVSSLIGHSLDCLDTGLPTLQMLHDFYPLWPFLDYDPMPFLDAEQGIDLDAAFAAHASDMRLRPQRAAFWETLGEAWCERVDRNNVLLMAPTRHVIERWQRMMPERRLAIEHQPHGFRPFETAESSEDHPHQHQPHSRQNSAQDADRPLHLLIPGRLTTGKGLQLIQQALPELRKVARLTALGCGREGLSLMGQSGIDLIPSYQRDELPALMRALKPDAALLLSTVPETWNYTLSEMRALSLVPIATNLGSFRERIEHGTDGWLIEPEPEALIQQVQQLAGEREVLRSMANQSPLERTLEDQAAAVREALPARPQALPDYRAQTIEQAERARLAAALANAEQSATRAVDALEGAQTELAERTNWAQTMERQFRQRSQWAERLNDELELSQREAKDLQQQLTQSAQQLEQTTQALEQTAIERERVQTELDQVFASRSWRVTRPLRVANRLLTNPAMRQLINPLNWPRLFGRLIHHWRLRGLKQTLFMLQQPAPVSEPITTSDTPIPQPDVVADPVHFRPVEQPVVSIIVPVYNQLHYTAACLHSLLSVEEALPFEIIVVNDASSDPTERWLNQCKGLTALHNQQNQGFIGSCNRGAEAARADYLLFLNNDTQVSDHWLSAMVDLFKAEPNAGVVGSRLVYADGTLQEAGGIIFSDGSGWNYGKHQEADRPEFNFVSEADYVSGASLMIPRALFESLQGFDNHYRPAYYEDTDLCFRVREQGLKVLYQPASTVVHFEGVTSGTDESSGTKQYQAVNRDKFFERWQSHLQRQPAKQLREDRPDSVRHLRYHRYSSRALVVDAVTPTPKQDSGSVRMLALLRILKDLGYQTSFMPSNLAWAGADSIRLQQAGIEVLTAPWLDDIEQWLDAHGADLDLVVVSRHYVLKPLIKLIRYCCPGARIIFDTVDLHFLREQREAELTGSASAARAAAHTRRDELKLIDQSDATLVVSQFEADLLHELRPQSHIQVVSNIHSLQNPGKPWADRKDLLFVGGFQHPPNLDAARWLVDELIPLIREALPDVRLHLIGSKMPESIRELRAPGLIVHGFVADLEPYLNSVRVSLAPLRFGAGVKGKVNQAMSHGLPVVATHCAAEGMYTQHGHDVLMADTAEDFAREVVRVYNDQALWETIAANGRQNVEQHFSVNAAKRGLSSVLNDIG